MRLVTILGNGKTIQARMSERQVKLLEEAKTDLFIVAMKIVEDFKTASEVLEELEGHYKVEPD